MRTTISPFRNNQVDLDQIVLAAQRSERGKHFESYMGKFVALKEGRADEQTMAEFRSMNARVKDLRPGDVHVDATLTNMSLFYANDVMIGDRVMPRITVGKKSTLYWVYPSKNVMSFPDDLISEDEAEIPRIKHSYETDSYRAQSRGLKEYVDEETIREADVPLEPLADANMYTNLGLDWNQEIRVASIVNTTANYDGNVFPVTAGDEWNADPAGNPHPIVREAIRSILPGMPGMTKLVGTMSLAVYDALSINPYILDMFNAGSGGRNFGFVPPQALAQILGLDEILVGRAWKNTANEGQTATLTRIWPDILAIHTVAVNATLKSYQWGNILQNGPKTTRIVREDKKGLAGGYYVITTRSQAEKVIAKKAGALITGCLA